MTQKTKVLNKSQKALLEALTKAIANGQITSLDQLQNINAITTVKVQKEIDCSKVRLTDCATQQYLAYHYFNNRKIVYNGSASETIRDNKIVTPKVYTKFQNTKLANLISALFAFYDDDDDTKAAFNGKSESLEVINMLLCKFMRNKKSNHSSTKGLKIDSPIDPNCKYAKSMNKTLKSVYPIFELLGVLEPVESTESTEPVESTESTEPVESTEQ